MNSRTSAWLCSAFFYISVTIRYTHCALESVFVFSPTRSKSAISIAVHLKFNKEPVFLSPKIFIPIRKYHFELPGDYFYHRQFDFAILIWTWMGSERPLQLIDHKAKNQRVCRLILTISTEHEIRIRQSETCRTQAEPLPSLWDCF